MLQVKVSVKSAIYTNRHKCEMMQWLTILRWGMCLVIDFVKFWKSQPAKMFVKIQETVNFEVS